MIMVRDLRHYNAKVLSRTTGEDPKVMKTKTWKTLGGMLALMFALMLTLTACATAEVAPADGEAQMEEQADAEMMDKPTIVFSDLSWDSAQIQNAVARYIIENGYGYETDAVFGDTVPMLVALRAGDVNVTMEIWLPNQEEPFLLALEEGSVEVVGKSLEDNWQSAFIIPQYVADANPNLRTVEDLKDHMELFVTPDSNGKARLLSCIPGWACEQVNANQVVAYGLSDVVELVNPGSDAALQSEIRAAFLKEEPVLFYYWGPTTFSFEMETELGGYYILEEPENNEECWADGNACAYPLAEVVIAVNTELKDAAPDVVELLGKWDWNFSNQRQAETYFSETGAEYADVAIHWLKNNDAWREWVTADAAEKIAAALAAEE